MKEIAVVVLNWNGKAHLETFLPSVVQHSSELADVYVIDNNSTDGSVEFLNKNFPTVKIIQLGENKGFTGGYNEGLKQIKAKYFAIINSDVEVTPNWLKGLLETIKQENAVACQPKIKSYKSKDFFEYAGAAGGFIDYLGYPFCRGRIFDTLEKDLGQYDTKTEVFWASGACFLIETEKFFEVGGFDNRFFAHMEEIDLCWRLKLRGYKIWCEPKSVVYHLGGGTLQKENPHKTFLNFRNNLLMLVKNYPKGKLASVLLTRLVLDGLAGVKMLMSGDISNCFAIIKAHFSFYSHFRYALSYRKSQASLLSYTFDEKVLKTSLVKEYFISKKTIFTQLKF